MPTPLLEARKLRKTFSAPGGAFAMGIRRPETARRVLVTRVNRERCPGDTNDLALAAALRVRATATGSLADARETATLAKGVWQRRQGWPARP